MSLLLLDQKNKRTILLIASIVLISVITFSTFLYHTTTSVGTESTTSSIVDSSYLTNEQTFFDAIDYNNTNAGTAVIPTPCQCSNYNKSNIEQMSNDAATITDSNLLYGNQQQHIDIPESIPPPPETLMKKINKNLFALNRDDENNDDKVLIVATANYGMRNHVYNWIETLKNTNEHKFLIFCFDQKLYDHLVLAGYADHASMIPNIWFHGLQLEADFKTYYSQEYRAITHAKTLVVQQLLYLNIHVFFSDVDVVWLRKRMIDYVTTLMDMREETHVLFQQEGLNQQEVNSGFYLMRPTTEMKKLLAETIQIQDAGGKTQQGALNAALNHLDMDLRTTSVALLDILYFPNGFVYFDNNLPDKHGIEPYVVHANYLVGDDKKTKLIERGFWYVNDTWLDQIDAKLEDKYRLKQQRQQHKNSFPKSKNATSSSKKQKSYIRTR